MSQGDAARTTTDTVYLKSEQYRTPVNLNSRIYLHERFSTNPYPWPQWVFDRLNLPPQARLLEVGCGPGYLWQQNLERVPGTWRVSLVDFSPGMIHQAKDNLRPLTSQFHFGVNDVQELPWGKETFDGVIANHMLYHIPDRPKALAEIHRVLKPGGRLYAATNGLDHMAEILTWMQQLDPEARSQLTLEFSLENGGEQLRRFFSQVLLHPYDDALEVTEVEPLIAYIRSMRRSPQVEQNIEALTHSFEQHLAARGAIHITKRSGLFEARK